MSSFSARFQHLAQHLSPRIARHWRPAASLLFLGLPFLAATAQTQAAEPIKPRIAVFPFDDRTTANKDMNIGAKVADLLIAKLTTDGAVTVYDRQYVDKLLTEKSLKYDPNYDSANAARAGLMGTVDIVIAGQITAFNANANESTKHQVVRTVHEIDGAVNLKVTARLISVEKGSVLIAPTAENNQNGILAQDNSYMKTKTLTPISGMGYDNTSAIKSQDQALRKLVDQAADQVALQLSSQIAPIAKTVQPVALVAVAVKPPTPGKDTVSAGGTHPTASFVGIIDGLAYIDKGSKAGIQPGDHYTIRHNADTALKDGSGHAIQRHKNLCTLTVSLVEADSAAGKCAPEKGLKLAEATPQAGDEAIPAAH